MSENNVSLNAVEVKDGDVGIRKEVNETSLMASASSPILAIVPEKAHASLARMFADPYQLEKSERGELVAELRGCVAANPEVSELRVLLGMALCVNFEVPDAIEELQESVRLSPDSFIANLKMGELWMRLRVMTKAEHHTRRAGKLAANMAQAEMARRQAASIRTMKHNGIERGGSASPRSLLTRLSRLRTRNRGEAIATVDVS